MIHLIAVLLVWALIGSTVIGLLLALLALLSSVVPPVVSVAVIAIVLGCAVLGIAKVSSKKL